MENTKLTTVEEVGVCPGVAFSVLLLALKFKHSAFILVKEAFHNLQPDPVMALTTRQRLTQPATQPLTPCSIPHSEYNCQRFL